MVQRINCSLIGVPDDRGVFNVGGRMGAALGPLAFRKAFARLSGPHALASRLLEEGDAGDAGPFGEEIKANHALSRAKIAQAHEKTTLSVVVGGSHDHGFPHLQAIQEVHSSRKPRIGCMNIDAHLDLRAPEPLITSGSPFYLAIESGVLNPAHLIEFGIQSQCNGPELWDYAKRKKIKILPQGSRRSPVAAFDQALRALSRQVDAVVISLDLDAIAAAHAPGVSAPQADGLTPAEVFQMLLIAGKCQSVVSLGIFELNPLHDQGGLTEVLAATAAYRFLEGLTQRARS